MLAVSGAVLLRLESLTAVADLNEGSAENPINLRQLVEQCGERVVRFTPDRKRVILQRGGRAGDEDVVHGLVSPEGKIEITGARSKDASIGALKLFTTWMSERLGRTIAFSDYRLTRAKSAADCGFRVRLEELHVALAPEQLLLFEPEVFPGLVMRAPGGAHAHVSVAVFASGRIELWAGGEDEGADLQAAFKPTYDLLRGFQDGGGGAGA